MISALSVMDDQHGARIVPTVGADPSVLLQGRTKAEAMGLLPLLFNLCPSAHRLAAAQALGVEIDPTWARSLAEETLLEHLMVMAREWPLAFGRAPELEALKGLKPLSHARLRELERAFFGPADDLDQAPQNGITDLIKTVRDWPESWGKYARPDVDTAFGRQITNDAPLAERVARDGPLLWLRLWGRYREAGRILGRLIDDEFNAEYGQSSPNRGWAEAARGRLFHHASLTGDRIKTYAIETPTQRLCAAQGQMNAMLATLKNVPSGMRVCVIKVLISALDPCVAIEFAQVADA
jgi:hypothetical protein